VRNIDLPIRGVKSDSESPFGGRFDSGHILLIDCTLQLRSFGQCTVLAGRAASSLYAIVHLLVEEEFRISLKSSLSTQSVFHTVNHRVGVGV